MGNIRDINETSTTENTAVNEELVKVTEIEETPFACLKIEDNYYLVLGKYRLTQAMESEEAVQVAATDASWHRIMQVCSIMIAESEELLKIKEEVETIKLLLNKPKND